MHKKHHEIEQQLTALDTIISDTVLSYNTQHVDLALEGITSVDEIEYWLLKQ